jgi:glycosyl transferase family 61
MADIANKHPESPTFGRWASVELSADVTPQPRPSAFVRCGRSIASRAIGLMAGTTMRCVRAVGGLHGFPPAMIGVETFKRENVNDDTVSVRQWHYTEEPRNVELIPGSDPLPALGGVRTTVSLLDVEDRRYSLRDGYLVDPALRMIYEEEGVAGFPYRRVALRRLETPTPVDGVVACLRQEDNYGHWLVLALPLIEYYRDALGGDPDFYYLGPTVRPWLYEALERLGIPASKTLTRAVTADRLLVAITDRHEGDDRRFLVYPSEALTSSTPSVAQAGRRVFVSRASAAHRRLLNESECIEALRAFDVEPVATEKLSLEDEIALFQEAELIVGAHGAGMINCVFSPPGAAVVELASESYLFFSQAAQLAAVRNQRFAVVRGPPSGLRIGMDASKHDFVVDVDRLTQVVDAACGGDRDRTPKPVE